MTETGVTLYAQQAQMTHGYLWYINVPQSRFSQCFQLSNDKNMGGGSENIFSVRKHK